MTKEVILFDKNGHGTKWAGVGMINSHCTYASQPQEFHWRIDKETQTLTLRILDPRINEHFIDYKLEFKNDTLYLTEQEDKQSTIREYCEQKKSE